MHGSHCCLALHFFWTVSVVLGPHCLMLSLHKQHQRFQKLVRNRLLELSPDLKNQNLHFKSDSWGVQVWAAALRGLPVGSADQPATRKACRSGPCNRDILEASQRLAECCCRFCFFFFFSCLPAGTLGLRWTSTGNLLPDNIFQGGLGAGVGKSRCVAIEEGSLRQKGKVLVWFPVNG